ncbi:MAG: hypothetical protein AAF351_12685 [Pseudomonadota bacterium]
MLNRNLVVDDLINDYEEIQDSQKLLRYAGYALKYGGAAAKGAVDAFDVPLKVNPLTSIGTAVALEGIDHASGAFLREAEERAEELMIYRLNDMMNGQLVDGNGFIDRTGLDNAASILGDERLYAELSESSRASVRYFQGRITDSRLREIADNQESALKDRVVLQSSIDALHELSLDIGQDLGEMNDSMMREFAEVNNAFASQNAVIEDIVDATTKNLTISEAMAEASLPAAVRLQLIEQNVLSATPSQIDALRRKKNADEILDRLGGMATKLNGVANALQEIDPELAGVVNDGANLLNAGAQLGAAYAMGDPMGMAMGAVNFAGALKGLGSSGGPSAEQLILKQLALMREEIREYHLTEMRAIEAVGENIDILRYELGQRLDNIQDDILTLAFDEYARDMQDDHLCIGLANAYKKHVLEKRNGTVSGFAEFFAGDGETIAINYKTCLRAMVLSLQDGFNSPLFTSNVAVQQGETITAAVDAARSVRDQYLYPIAKSLPTNHDDYRETVRRYQGLIQSLYDSPGDPGDAYPAPISFGLGYSNPGSAGLLRASSILSLSRAYRAVTQWAPMLRELDQGEGFTRPLSLAEVEDCLDRNTACLAMGLDSDLERLRQMRKYLVWLLTQEHMISGLPAIHPAYKALDQAVLQHYRSAYNKTDLEITTQFIDDIGLVESFDGNNATGCDETDNIAWQTLCRMERNRYFASNTITLLVNNRLQKWGPNRYRLYAAALEWDTPEELNRLLGDDIVFFGVGIEEQGKVAPTPMWSIVLPRPYYRSVAQGVEGAQGVRISNSEDRCWSTGIPSLTLQGEDDFVLSRAHRLRWSRCMLLPSAETVKDGKIASRVPLTEIHTEIENIDATIAELEYLDSLRH